ncbi:exosortase-associated protein EpsI, B-type, partial [Ideonella azotifigens]
DVPERFAGWQLDPQGEVLVVNPEQQAFIDRIYSQTLSRVYLDGAGQRVMLSVAYGEDQRRGSALHEPEICYPAQGFRIQRRSQGEVRWMDGARSSAVLPVQRLETVLNAQRFEPLSYWIVIGRRRVVGALERKLALYHYGLQGLIADGMIVRVSTVGRDSAQEFALQARFIAELLATLPEPVRSRLAGREEPA